MRRMLLPGMQATAWPHLSRLACLKHVDDVWEANGLNDQLKSAAASMTMDGKKWGVPYTYYQWGIYYNKEAYKKAGVKSQRTGLSLSPTAKSSKLLALIA